MAKKIWPYLLMFFVVVFYIEEALSFLRPHGPPQEYQCEPVTEDFVRQIYSPEAGTILEKFDIPKNWAESYLPKIVETLNNPKFGSVVSRKCIGYSHISHNGVSLYGATYLIEFVGGQRVRALVTFEKSSMESPRPKLVKYEVINLRLREQPVPFQWNARPFIWLLALIGVGNFLSSLCASLLIIHDRVRRWPLWLIASFFAAGSMVIQWQADDFQFSFLQFIISTLTISQPYEQGPHYIAYGFPIFSWLYLFAREDILSGKWGKP